MLLLPAAPIITATLSFKTLLLLIACTPTFLGWMPLADIASGAPPPTRHIARWDKSARHRQPQSCPAARKRDSRWNQLLNCLKVECCRQRRREWYRWGFR